MKEVGSVKKIKHKKFNKIKLLREDKCKVLLKSGMMTQRVYMNLYEFI